jgi:hypothetical protein
MWTIKIFFTQWRQTLTIGNNLFQKILMDFNGILWMCKTTNVLWWCTKRMQVFDSCNFFGIPTSQMEIKRFFSTIRLLSALWRCLQIEDLD